MEDLVYDMYVIPFDVLDRSLATLVLEPVTYNKLLVRIKFSRFWDRDLEVVLCPFYTPSFAPTDWE